MKCRFCYLPSIVASEAETGCILFSLIQGVLLWWKVLLILEQTIGYAFVMNIIRILG